MSRPKKNDKENLVIPDYKIKPLKQFFRPYFSPRLNSWEMDWIQTPIQNWETNPETGEVIPADKLTRQYFGCINLNTRYFYMIPLKPGDTYSMANTIKCLKEIQADLQNKFGPDAKINNLRGDGEKEFGKVDSGKEVSYIRKAESIDMITHYLIGSEMTRFARDEG
jgi:hypothetical protein